MKQNKFAAYFARDAGAGSILLTKSQLLTFPRGSGINGAVSSCRHLPSTMNLYWWYLQCASARKHMSQILSG